MGPVPWVSAGSTASRRTTFGNTTAFSWVTRTTPSRVSRSTGASRVTLDVPCQNGNTHEHTICAIRTNRALLLAREHLPGHPFPVLDRFPATGSLPTGLPFSAKGG